MRRIALISLSFLSACSSAGQWQLSSIAAGDVAFNSSRLRFVPLTSHPLLFEIIQFSDRTESFISLRRFRFSEAAVEVTLTIGGETFQETAHVYEGAMRLKLSEESSDRIIQALQEGLEVGILVDGFEERLIPNQFPLKE